MSIFPFISPDTSKLKKTELPMFREYAYDYDNNALLLRQGKTYLIEGNEALKIWIYKAVFTARYRYLAYSSDYGCEIETLIGNVIDDIITSEIRRFIVETVMVNPYIKELSNFVFTKNASSIIVNFDCLTIYGMMNMQLGLKGAGV